MNIKMTSTTFEIAGSKIEQNLGVVKGITVRSRSIIGNLAGSLQTIFGGNITVFTNLCEKTRDEAFSLMLSHAEQVGADAIVGIRYESNDIMDGVTEVLCYGTAVKIAR